MVERTQRVEVGGARSYSRFLGEYGAPQGSILAGLLYLIYANDIPDNTSEKKSILFVDDTTELVKAARIPELNHKLQEETNKSIRWMDNNMMRISENKTKILMSSTRALRALHQQPVEITVKGKRIVESTSEKILGIVFSNDLTWKHHLCGEPEKPPQERTEGLLSVLSKRVGIIRKLARILPQQALQSLVAGLFTSKLLFGLPLKGGCWQTNINRVGHLNKTAWTKQDTRTLQCLQNKVMWILLRNEDRQKSTSQLLQKTGFLSIHQLCLWIALLVVHKSRRTGKSTWLMDHLEEQHLVRGGPASEWSMLGST